jgi:hypothetical protein
MNDILIFDSRFESGNLFSCIKTEETDIPTYELYIQNDTNTKGCTQWFYFSTINRIRTKVKFRLMNFVFILLFSINLHPYFKRV